jgi:hypothetical protein
MPAGFADFVDNPAFFVYCAVSISESKLKWGAFPDFLANSDGDNPGGEAS